MCESVIKLIARGGLSEVVFVQMGALQSPKFVREAKLNISLSPLKGKMGLNIPTIKIALGIPRLKCKTRALGPMSSKLG